jgi:hypothetical protein
MTAIQIDSRAEVRARVVQTAAQTLRSLPSASRVAWPMLDPDAEFVRLAPWVDLLWRCERELGATLLRQAGVFLGVNARPPNDATTVEGALKGIEPAYREAHRGHTGRCESTRKRDGRIAIRCWTPYPPPLVWGFVEGLCRGRLAGGRSYVVECPVPEAGDEACTILVRPPVSVGSDHETTLPQFRPRARPR